MTSVKTRHAVAERLGAEPPLPQLSLDFVSLLAAFGAYPDEAARLELEAQLSEGQPPVESLEEDLEARIPEDAPTAPRLLDRWLVDVEAIGLALHACKVLGPDVVQPALVAALEWKAEILNFANCDPNERSWDCELVAEVTRAGLPDGIPWRWIRSRRARGTLVPGMVDESALEALLAGHLHVEDSTALYDLVRSDPAWKAGYRAMLRVDGGAVYLPRVDANASITAAVTEDELDRALCLLAVRLPHLGDGVEFEARLGADGVWWRWIGIDRPTEHSPRGAESHTWGDDVLGRAVVAIRPMPTTELQVAQDVAHSTTSLAEGLPHPRTASIALHVADDLARGRLRSGLERAAATFAAGADETDDESRWAKLALWTRLAASKLAARLCRDDLDLALDDADARLAHTAGALLLLDDTSYDNLVEDAFLDPDRWWGARARLDDELPEAALHHSLDRMRERRDASPPNVVYPAFGGGVRASDRARDEPRWLAAADSEGTRTALARLAEVATDDAAAFEAQLRIVCPRLWETPCPWLDRAVVEGVAAVEARHPEHAARLEALRAAITPMVGAVPVVLVDTRDGRAFVIEARVSRGRAGRSESIGPLAWEALGRAFEAAARHSPMGLPRFAIDDHVLMLVGLPVDAEVDGASLALPLLLAYASLWSNRPVPTDLVATGDVERRDDEFQIRGVDGIPAKAQAVARLAGAHAVRLITAAGDEAGAQSTGVVALGVRTVGEALGAAGFDLEGAAFTPAWPDIESMQAQLEADIRRVEFQQLDDIGGLGDPWSTLAARMRLLIDALSEASPDAPLLERARLRCALAFEHAGRLDEAVDVLPEQIEDARLGPELAVVASVVRLGAAIDREDWADCDALSAQLDAHLDSCGQTERARVLGVARGAQGRALLHQRRVSDAIARFHEAIAWHREAQRHELARSRVHLASALRVAGDPSAALRELDAARLDLAITRERSRPYAATTEMFLHYEQARALLDAGRVDEARYTAEAALRRAGVRGFWPQLGVLRVLAWAHAQLGDTAAAAVAIDRMRRLAVPPAHEGLRDRLLTEAEAGPGDVIY